MSNAQEQHPSGHSSPVRTPKQLITIAALAFIVPVIVILMLASYVARGTRGADGSDAFTPQAVSARIAPVAGFALVDVNAPREYLTGEQVYKQVCTACHAAGVAGAPRTGDKDAWAPFIAQGFDALLQVAIQGKGAMPPKGGAANLSDYEIARAVVYLANQGGGDFEEPAAPEEGEGEEASQQAAGAAPVAPAPQAAAAAPAAAPASEPAPASGDAAAETPAAASGAAGAIAISDEAHTVGKKIYDTTCVTCHAAGIAGAPKLGDKAAWAPYVATGMDQMLAVAIKGKGAMPPRGTAMNASDAELRAAIEYMVSQVQ
ncbi:cytochrome c5 family protein [Verticiella sediminum]|uniref:Cytochrome c5 family protein n=1 Tax=Verticiella sediminum TaxID=1247510 RepID=A0A556B005_9BURK|nr:c-type cytochrome [Verticiella sediminum]TSH98512.1 cytochrome c5 family protein [Verticiella sediminum]